MSSRPRVTGKLIRDRVLETFGWQGVSPLPDADFVAALRAKLGEEVAEDLNAVSSEERCAELVDVLEVVLALAAQDGLTPDELEAARRAKFDERGGCSQRLWWQP